MSTGEVSQHVETPRVEERKMLRITEMP